MRHIIYGSLFKVNILLRFPLDTFHAFLYAGYSSKEEIYMARKKSRIQAKPSLSSKMGKDLGSWNFVIFLTLAFLLLVVVVASMKGVALDLRSRAGLACPNPLAAFNGQLPQSSECNGEWKLGSDARGCQVFLCQPK